MTVHPCTSPDSIGDAVNFLLLLVLLKACFCLLAFIGVKKFLSISGLLKGFFKKANVFYVSSEMVILNIFIVKYIMCREEVCKTHEYSPKNNM